MKYIFYTYVFMFFFQASKGQDYSHIDDYVSSFECNAQTPNDLIKSLIKEEWTEDEKVRALYVWIGKNIQYNGYFDNTLKIKEYDNWEEIIALRTFDKREGICGNYAALFKYMCRIIGIEARTVNGYVREHGSMQAGIPVPDINHAWNIVKTNGKEHFLDVTWGGRMYRYDETLFNYYFYTAPERFIATRFSNDQLLPHPVTKAEFDQYPYVSDCFFFDKTDNTFPKNGTIKTSSGQVDMYFIHPDTLGLLQHILTNDLKWINPPYRFKRSGETYRLDVDIRNLPGGEHIITLGTDCGGFLAFRVIYRKDK